ncbi:MAG: hypothetical protein QXG65_01250 [Thermoplasmata archaeon]
MNGTTEWLRGRGIGRERFAGYLAEYLGTLGYEVVRTETGDPPRTLVAAHLARPNPAIPASAQDLRFSFYPTSGGSGVAWEAPTGLSEGDAGRMDRFVREISTHLERAVSTGSHAAARVVRSPVSSLPWQSSPSGPAVE